MAKTPPSDFKVTTPENPLLSKQAVTSKGILVPYTNLQLNPYPNTQLDLLYSNNLFFQCTAPSTWLTNCVDPSMRLQSPTKEGCWLQSSSIHHMMKIEKFFGYKTLRCTNTTASSQERWTKANSVSGHNLLKQTLLNTCGVECTCLPSFLEVLFWVMLNFLLVSGLYQPKHCWSVFAEVIRAWENDLSFYPRFNFLLLPADADPRVDCLSAFIFLLRLCTFVLFNTS